MGSIATIDTRLGELADRGPKHAKPALEIALCQYLVSKNTGHILALNDEFVWRKLREAASQGLLPIVNVRCIRCYSVARMRDWIRSGNMTDERRFSLWEEMRQKYGEIQAKFLHACPGEAQAEDTLEALRYLEEKPRT